MGVKARAGSTPVIRTSVDFEVNVDAGPARWFDPGDKHLAVRRGTTPIEQLLRGHRAVPATRGCSKRWLCNRLLIGLNAGSIPVTPTRCHQGTRTRERGSRTHETRRL